MFGTAIRKKKNFIVNKNIILFNFDYNLKSIILQKNDNINHKLIFIVNYFHYKGFLGLSNNKLFFKNNKSIMKFVRKITNLIKGLLRGYCLILEIIGLGFTVTNNNKYLRFNIGYNHSIFYFFNEKVKICSKRKLLFIFSYSYFILKNVITDIKNFRKLNVYKLKGIKEKNELYVKKNWKKKIS